MEISEAKSVPQVIWYRVVVLPSAPKPKRCAYQREQHNFIWEPKDDRHGDSQEFIKRVIVSQMSGYTHYEHDVAITGTDHLNWKKYRGARYNPLRFPQKGDLAVPHDTAPFLDPVLFRTLTYSSLNQFNQRLPFDRVDYPSGPEKIQYIDTAPCVACVPRTVSSANTTTQGLLPSKREFTSGKLVKVDDSPVYLPPSLPDFTPEYIDDFLSGRGETCAAWAADGWKVVPLGCTVDSAHDVFSPFNAMYGRGDNAWTIAGPRITANMPTLRRGLATQFFRPLRPQLSNNQSAFILGASSPRTGDIQQSLRAKALHMDEVDLFMNTPPAPYLGFIVYQPRVIGFVKTLKQDPKRYHPHVIKGTDTNIAKCPTCNEELSTTHTMIEDMEAMWADALERVPASKLDLVSGPSRAAAHGFRSAVVANLGSIITTVVAPMSTLVSGATSLASNLAFNAIDRYLAKKSARVRAIAALAGATAVASAASVWCYPAMLPAVMYAGFQSARILARNNDSDLLPRLRPLPLDPSDMKAEFVVTRSPVPLIYCAHDYNPHDKAERVQIKRYNVWWRPRRRELQSYLFVNPIQFGIQLDREDQVPSISQLLAPIKDSKVDISTCKDICATVAQSLTQAGFKPIFCFGIRYSNNTPFK